MQFAKFINLKSNLSLLLFLLSISLHCWQRCGIECNKRSRRFRRFPGHLPHSHGTHTSQAHFLINSGLLEGLEGVESTQRAPALKLINEHEMGELFKVLVLGVGVSFDPLGCERGDRTHTL